MPSVKLVLASTCDCPRLSRLSLRNSAFSAARAISCSAAARLISAASRAGERGSMMAGDCSSSMPLTDGLSRSSSSSRPRSPPRSRAACEARLYAECTFAFATQSGTPHSLSAVPSIGPRLGIEPFELAAELSLNAEQLPRFLGVTGSLSSSQLGVLGELTSAADAPFRFLACSSASTAFLWCKARRLTAPPSSESESELDDESDRKLRNEFL